MDATNMYGIDLINEIDDVLEKMDGNNNISQTEIATKNIEDLVQPIAAVKLTESVAESVTAESRALPISTHHSTESVPAGSSNVRSESVNAEDQQVRVESITVGSSSVPASLVQPASRVRSEMESVTAGSSGSSVISRHSCRVCNRRHLISTCKEFLAMTVQERIEVIEAHRDCTRCLAKWHEAKECHSKKSCVKCRGRHNTLLHSESEHIDAINKRSVRSRNSVRTGPYPSPSFRPRVSSIPSSSVDHRQVSHFVGNSLGSLTFQTVSTISPSLIVRLQNVIPSIPIRAVLDPCGRQSRICSSMVSDLRLPTSNLDGNMFCRITVASNYDPSQRISVMAKVTDLRHVFTPSEPIPQSVKESFLGLPLADPCFYTPGRVALVFGPDVYAKVVTNRVQAMPGLPVAHYTIFEWVLSGVCYT
ncbi:uncharacterized protein [Musca autumnalis]|uniref:uncharacterized protein n=1 Tax=Musca autumnalis TaxID=221902 RepID=UPI003CFB6E9B